MVYHHLPLDRDLQVVFSEFICRDATIHVVMETTR